MAASGFMQLRFYVTSARPWTEGHPKSFWSSQYGLWMMPAVLANCKLQKMQKATACTQASVQDEAKASREVTRQLKKYEAGVEGGVDYTCAPVIVWRVIILVACLHLFSQYWNETNVVIQCRVTTNT